jgi:4'-phosphopantetheinyl transferase
MIDVWLARSERARACTDSLARAVLGGRLGVPPMEVQIRRRCLRCGATDHGKPYVEGHPIHFSVSSAGDRVAVATASVGVGIDLVRVADMSMDAAGAILAPGEEADDDRELSIVWARKEALLKATGDGLAIDPRSVRVSHPHAPAALLAWPQRTTHGVRLGDLALDPQDGYVSSVAWLSGTGTRIVVHPDATALLKGAHL